MEKATRWFGVAALDPLLRPGNLQGRPLPHDTNDPVSDALHRAALTGLRPLQNGAAWTDELDGVMWAQSVVLHGKGIGQRCRPVKPYQCHPIGRQSREGR